MARYIKLNKSDMTVYVAGRTEGYRYQVVVEEVIDMPAEVFVYQRKYNFGDVTAFSDVFSNIASPADLEELPIGAPDPSQPNRPFFRLSAVDLIFRSACLADDAYRVLKIELENLVRTLNYMDTLALAETIEIGTPPTSSSSSSSL